MHQQPQHSILYAGTTSAGHRLQGTAAGAHWAMPQAACSQEPLQCWTQAAGRLHIWPVCCLQGVRQLPQPAAPPCMVCSQQDWADL